MGKQKLIAAKTRIPSTPDDYMSRPRLTAKLDSFASLPLITVVAPAGYGKTSLVAAWAALRGSTVAWYTLSDDDRQPGIFWNYLITTCSQVLGENFPKHSLFTEGNSISTDLIDSFVVALEEFELDMCLVLEDYHRLGGSEKINSILLRIIENAPSTFHLVVVSRTVPSLRLSKLRMSDALGELNEDDLRFSRQETAHFLVKGRVALPEDYINSFYEVTCGWPIALKVAVLNMRRVGEEGLNELQKLVQSSSGEYLYEEAVEQQPAFVKQFLLATACLDSFSSSVAAALIAELKKRCPDFFVAQFEENETAESFTAQSLSHLVDNNVFIAEARTLEGEPWYCYHMLLSEALRYVMVRRYGVAFRESNRVAGIIMQQLGLLDQAVQYFAQAKDYDAIRDVIFSQWQEAIYDDNVTPIKRWFDFLPDDYIEQFPRLCLYQMPTLYVSGQFMLAHRRYNQVLSMAKESNDEYLGLAYAQLALCYAVESRDLEAGEQAEKALERLPETETHFRSMMLQVMAGAVIEKNPLEAKRLMEQACSAGEEYVDRNVVCSAWTNLALLTAKLGYIEESLRYASDAQALYGNERDFESLSMLTTVFAAQALAFYLRGQLSQARTFGDRFLAQLSLGYIARNEAELETILACIAMARGNSEEALERINSAMLVYPEGIANMFPGLDYLTEWVNDEDVCASLHRCAAGGKDESSFAQLWLTQALALVERKDPDSEVMQMLHDQASYSGPLGAIQVEILAASWAEKRELPQQALEHLARSVEEAALHGVVQPFMTASRYIKEPLRELAKKQPKSYADELYKMLCAQVEVDTDRTNERPISDRELDIMRLVDAGLSTSDIADKLFISRETVKKHLGNIYGKLGVHSRTQAAAILRVRGLL